jgi:hypothetical protein
VCPVCGEPASILDWRPSIPWLAVDGCRCDGIFVWTAILETRLPQVSAEERAILCARIFSGVSFPRYMLSWPLGASIALSIATAEPRTPSHVSALVVAGPRHPSSQPITLTVSWVQ